MVAPVFIEIFWHNRICGIVLRMRFCVEILRRLQQHGVRREFPPWTDGTNFPVKYHRYDPDSRGPQYRHRAHQSDPAGRNRIRFSRHLLQKDPASRIYLHIPGRSVGPDDIHVVLFPKVQERQIPMPSKSDCSVPRHHPDSRDGKQPAFSRLQPVRNSDTGTGIGRRELISRWLQRHEGKY